MTVSSAKANTVGAGTYTAPDIGAADSYAQTTYAVDNAVQFPLCLKLDAAGNGICAQLAGNLVRVRAVNAGAIGATDILNVTSQPSAVGAVLKLHSIGSTFYASVNGTIVGSGTITSGREGFTKGGLFSRTAVTGLLSAFSCGTGVGP